ncbi:Aminopeptidase N [Sulfidibacter corallicola]|uniref:Aminopeptidase N n=1 Tax=Sulfidibacter corallicola TaxID=2818388 RepID=A0A8A4TRI3_SULCO|nr:M1 family metallopeptidase [Sulfidibacter corallicola]QTD51784.1 M1 family metallopeptidase [Sulfidibacter corallicola]
MCLKRGYLSPTLALVLLCVLVATGWAADVPKRGHAHDTGFRHLDVRRMELDVELFPDRKAIAAVATLEVVPLDPEARFLELDLAAEMHVETVRAEGRDLVFHHENGHLRILAAPGHALPARFEVRYGGQPQVAKRPPWDDGFVWSTDGEQQPWISLSCQVAGANIWFPAHDYPSDKIDHLVLNVTIPKPLFCAANGLLRQVTEPDAERRTFQWVHQGPIGAYNVSINVADYRQDHASYPGVRDIPVSVYTLRHPPDHARIADDRSYDRQRADLMGELHRYLDFYSQHFGPFPFDHAKVGVAHTPYLGMEHQTINAYGNRFHMVEGYDWLLLHELGHEWWGNHVTALNWNELWLHEGICTYATGVFLEESQGMAAAQRFFTDLRGRLTNVKPLIPNHPTIAAEAYQSDLYGKGALMLHGLRFLIGKPNLDHVLYRFATEHGSDRQSGATTCDFEILVQEVAGRDLGWYFDAYLRTSELPRLEIQETGNQLELRWSRPDFPMPVEISWETPDRGTQWAQVVPGGEGLSLTDRKHASVDPRQWVLKKTVDHRQR